MKKIPIIFFTCMVSACGGSGGSSNNDATDTPINEEQQQVESVSEAISELQSTGEIPALDTSSSLEGIDSDTNGIRDDIDAYISSLPVSNEQKLVIENTASALQAIQTIDLTNDTSLQASAKNLNQSVVCLSAAFDNPADAHKYLKSLENYTANTQMRAEQYNEFNAARDGSVTRLPSSSNCQ